MRSTIWIHIVGWISVAGMFYAGDLADPRVSRAEMLYNAVTLCTIGGGIAGLLWWLYQRIAFPRGSRLLWIGALASATVAGFTWFTLIHLLDWLVGFGRDDESPLSWQTSDLIDTLMLYFFPMLAWHAAALSQREFSRASRAEHLAQHAQLQALRYQLNPHLLFNALNSAVALIEVEPGRARTMLMRLAGLLRHTLHDTGSDSTLGVELDVIREYIAIEQVRFEEKLEVEVDIADELSSCHVPSLLLHSLVENAVKHGHMRSDHPLRIRIVATRHDDELRIEVTNTGRLESTKGGIGLDNVRRRLEAHYPGSHRFSIAEHDGQVRAEIAIRSPMAAP